MDGASNSSSLPNMDTPVLDVKPLRCLAPMFPNPFGYNAFPAPNSSAYSCTPPFGAPPLAPMFTPVFPAFAPPSSQTQSKQTPQVSNGVPTAAGSVPESNSPATGVADVGESPSPEKKESSVQPEPAVGKRRGSSSATRIPDPSGSTTIPGKEDGSQRSRKRRAYRKVSGDGTALFNVEDGDRESVERILMTFDGLRKRLLQIDDIKGATTGGSKRPDLKAGTIMMTNGYRTNNKKRIGAVPGVEIGDLFYFRFEMCLLGLHAPSMAGIDYMPVKFDKEEEQVAVSIVSSGGYEDDDMGDTDVLIYSGQGGLVKPGKQVHDQKLERGNLALENSSSRANDIRVIRGIKDVTNAGCKIYMYDGLYKIEDSWIEKGKSGFSVFKYKLIRVQGQPEGSAVWKKTRQWKDNPLSRGFVILPDLSSGVEKLPVCLVNEVDKDRGPAHFSYVNTVKYAKAITSVKVSLGCKCYNSCSPSDASCQCSTNNGGLPSYSSTGILASQKPLVYECGSTCMCSLNCRNRVSQKGTKIQFEVFKTRGLGWGLRSWDPIRGGSFICEYTGEVVDCVKLEDENEDNEYIFEASTCNRNFLEWNCKHELLGEQKPADPDESSRSLSIIINAKDIGNVSRFMNHSCSPNVFWQPVLYDHEDENYPHIMFFALKHIPPMTELTYDYGLSRSHSGEKSRRKCFCGSSNCRGFFG
ncbi:histone-lysine N-methyltransferase, H3 lysine-9 specific SUVH1-like [Aristolochia californica]|uniref:histone-lysine N-methyltransferase, H3 lysine-9 specific SUVH1-like n=1 Tax=Aristolochia californica TaxID=171875 RepID=UPI0035D6D492